MFRISFKNSHYLLLFGALFGFMLNFSPLIAQQKHRNYEKYKTCDSFKAFNDIIDSSFVESRGLFNVYNKGEKWYVEIHDSLLSRDLMCVTRYSQIIAGATFFAGELAAEHMIHFYKISPSKIVIRAPGSVIFTDEDTPISKAVENSSLPAIIESFDIISMRDDNYYLIDMSSFFISDISLFMKPQLKLVFGVTNLDSKRSYIGDIKSYPINTEIKTIRTYNGKTDSRIKAVRETGALTLELNTSIVLLPKEPMRVREYDDRVGFFWNTYDHFKENSQKATKTKVAVRWRLEPKSKEDEAKQRRGELIEPAKPIVFYIDPATPDKWKPFLKAGVDDWRIAFEAAGWKNAIRGEYWPEDDTTMSLEDARFSVIRYLASPYSNAYGPNVNDPRSGEIIESHIGWYHNIMQLLHEWYFIQTAASNPSARGLVYNDSVMGQLIRFVSSHEVGHSLGLMHNMRASYATPVEKLRDSEWLAKFGHTASIMDYARFNYVAQPEDGVTDFLPRINDYDKWAIKWGYSFFGADIDDKKEKIILNDWIIDAYKDPRLRYMGEEIVFDPRNQMEDLGDNSIKASEYGIRNLKVVVDSLYNWCYQDRHDYSELKRLYDAVVSQYNRYLFHVVNNIGGIYVNPLTFEMDGVGFEPVPRDKQRDALQFLKENLFTPPIWIFNDRIIRSISAQKPEEYLNSWYTKVITALFSPHRLARLEPTEFSESSYDYIQMINDLTEMIFSNNRISNNIKVSDRNLQRIYLNTLMELYSKKLRTSDISKLSQGRYSSDYLDSDLKSAIRGSLNTIEGKLKKIRYNRFDNLANKNHFNEISESLKSLK